MQGYIQLIETSLTPLLKKKKKKKKKKKNALSTITQGQIDNNVILRMLLKYG